MSEAMVNLGYAAMCERDREIARKDALIDSAYIAGAQAGYNLGLNENHEGLAAIVTGRAGYLKPLRNEQKAEGTNK